MSTTTSNNTEQQSTRMKTTHTLLHAYSTLSVPALTAPLSPTFTHTVLPTTLSMPSRDFSSFSQHATGIFNVFSSFQMIPDAIFEDAAQNAVVVKARMVGELKGGMEWRNECVLFLRFTQGGEAVEAIEEFVDSAKALEMRKNVKPEGFDGEQSV
ncbi:hypothetical protein K490DRAFT_68925 [Saccharata proteae CBS 121410]|uniref:Uncharacterized protein n=1 Tax=Saccharata proteae CBS 121410 TaxID=1314787 RepID=A0A9P4LVQ0_9PEZI|nr:hypothetical protein K490DRAFT_68925 [Saccharata proteae CBS 121410]